MPQAEGRFGSPFWSIVIALGVLGLKFVAWRMTGSVALYSDALELIVNVIAAVRRLLGDPASATSRPTATTSTATTRPSISRPCSKAC